MYNGICSGGLSVYVECVFLDNCHIDVIYLFCVRFCIVNFILGCTLLNSSRVFLMLVYCSL
jgi:hypothetical protein